MKQLHYWGILVVLMVFSTSIYSQKRFKAAVVGGVNFSQIDGDNFSGYDKIGWIGGLRASTIFTKKIQLDLELLFSQRGSVSDDFAGLTRTPHYFDIRLNYIEIPVLFSYKWKKIKSLKSKKGKFDYFQYAFNGGFSVGRVLQANIEERLDLRFIDPFLHPRITSWKLIEDQINRTDIALTLGFSYYFNKKVGVLLRSSTSLTPLYRPENNEGYGKLMRNFYLTTMAFYQF